MYGMARYLNSSEATTIATRKAGRFGTAIMSGARSRMSKPSAIPKSAPSKAPRSWMTLCMNR